MLLLVVLFGGLGQWWRMRSREDRYDELIREAAALHDVDPALVKAVVWRESRFRVDARGGAGELGLMQLQENAAIEWADAAKLAHFDHVHCLDARTNLLAGTFYLHQLLQRYAQTDDPVPYALADYNAGRTRVLKWNDGKAATNSAVFIEQIGFPTTKDYVQQVMRRRTHYARGW
jgi:soluble lytic murein transglycosylase